MQVLLRRAFLLAFAVLALLPPAAARADSLTFWIMSDHDNEIAIEFSANPNRYWPGYGESWLIDDYEQHSYVLNCERGESICYGAWEPNGDLRWGVGYQRDRRCEDCCYTCNGNTETELINLTSY